MASGVIAGDRRLFLSLKNAPTIEISIDPANPRLESGFKVRHGLVRGHHFLDEHEFHNARFSGSGFDADESIPGGLVCNVQGSALVGLGLVTEDRKDSKSCDREKSNPVASIRRNTSPFRSFGNPCSFPSPKLLAPQSGHSRTAATGQHASLRPATSDYRCAQHTCHSTPVAEQQGPT
jgi:hypothetical protein